MKKHWLLGAAAMMLASSVVAQSSNNQDEVVKIERHAARDYREGEMIVKFKPTSEVRVRARGRSITSGVSGVDKVLGELGITASEQLMPLTGEVVESRAKALRSVSGNTIEDSDMSQLYRLTFDAAKTNVHEAVEKLAALDEVEYAEPNYVVYTLSSDEIAAADDPLKGEQWGHGQLKLDFLQKQKPITDKRPVIAILDTGIDIEHPDLKDNIWTNEAELNGAEDEDDDANGFKDDLHGWDFVNQTARLGDWNGHGTHCAGIAAAVGNNKIGVTGANPDALIMPITVMQSDGTGDVATIIKGIDYAAANGADVISMSIGGYGYSLAEEQALAKAYSTAVLVAAAGNDCLPISPIKCSICSRRGSPMFPAAFTFVLGVEASTKEGSLASFSNFDDNGPVFSTYSEEQLYNYELRAPGAQIMSTFPGGKYKTLSGTSMACPYVAGGISRLLQVKEYGNWEILFGDLIHARKHRCEHDHDENVDFEAVYKITDADRKPSLGMVTYVLDDAEGGDGDGKADAGETIALYPTFRNEWGQAKNIRFSLALAETEAPTIVEILDSEVDFGKELSSYGKNKSANPVRFKVNPECVDGRHICMVLRATCDNIAEEFEQEIVLTAENGVEIGGIIAEDMTLYPNVHYIVTKQLLIPQGVTLTIMPGAVLRFKNGTGLKSEGKLMANGTPDNMITFRPAELLAECSIKIFDIGNGDLSYAIIQNLYFDSGIDGKSSQIENVIIDNCKSYYLLEFTSADIVRSVIKNNHFNYSGLKDYNNGFCIACNIVNNEIGGVGSAYPAGMDLDITILKKCNSFANQDGKLIVSAGYNSSQINIYKSENPSYLGSMNEKILRKNIIDYENPIYSFGYGSVNLDYVSKRPIDEAHCIVWKVVVNGYDAQDEFEQLPPLGVGKHKFEVYFNRPMDKRVTPMVAMGVRPPYTSHMIAEDGSWNEEGTIYTTYLTIDGKTGADGLNRIYVADAIESSEDYYLREELYKLVTKAKPLCDSLVLKYFSKVPLQSTNSSVKGYVFRGDSYIGGQNIKTLIDNDVNTDFTMPSPEANITIDLGDAHKSQNVVFDILSKDYDLKSVLIQGSNDLEEFCDIATYNVGIKLLEAKKNRSTYSLTIPLIESGTPYRFYRMVFNSCDRYAIAELGMRLVNDAFNEEFESTHKEIYDKISYAYYMYMSDSKDNGLLKTVLNQLYSDYNKLANTLNQPTIEQQSIEVPSTPIWKIPVENKRFSVQVEAAGSMATGLMAEAGLGKVTLTWETDEEDFEDLLGYNMYRFTMDDNGVSSDSVIINPSVLEAEETSFVDYDVAPGTTYYYVIKQLTTSLNSHALSNAVAATPLTASKGDANGSMSVDIADVVTEVAYITYQDPQPFIFEAADVNSDQKVNVLDVVGTIGIITNPAGVGVSGMDNEPVQYYVSDGILYVETAQALGGVQVRLNVAKGTEITALDGVKGMEQNGTWLSDEEYLFLAYSMSGQSIPAGTHALLQIGDEAVVTDMVLSDTKGKNITAVNGNTTGIGKVEAVQMQMPAPNPFTTVLRVPYTIGKSGSHEVTIAFSDMAGRTIDAYHTENTQGEYTYTWYPRALQKGLYLVSLYLDGELMQTVKVIRE